MVDSNWGVLPSGGIWEGLLPMWLHLLVCVLAQGFFNIRNYNKTNMTFLFKVLRLKLSGNHTINHQNPKHLNNILSPRSMSIN